MQGVGKMVKIKAFSLRDHMVPSKFEPRMDDVSLLYSKHVVQLHN